MNESSLEWKEVEVISFSRMNALDEKIIGAGNARPFSLNLEYRPDCLHFRSAIFTACCFTKPRSQRLSELAGEGKSAAHPSRNRAADVRSTSHPRDHVANAHELERRSSEYETIARLESRDERFFN